MCKRGQQIPLVAQALSHHQLSPQNICPHPWAPGHHRCCPAFAAHACPCPNARAWRTHQRSRLCVQRVRGVDELEAGLGVVGDLLSVLEPLVVRFWKAFLFHAAQLGRLPKRHRLWDAAFWHHRFYCGDAGHFSAQMTVRRS